jgi:hypothetical protein
MEWQTVASTLFQGKNDQHQLTIERDGLKSQVEHDISSHES